MAVTTPTAERAKPAEIPGNDTIPPLENGDRLTRAEFERRYEAMPELKKAELIEGVVHVPSPVRQRYHGRQHSHLNFWLCAYEGSTLGVEVGDNSTVRLDLDNMPQPDCLLFVQPEHGGRVRIGAKGYLEGAPELVGEVASSSSSYDLGDKLRAYWRNGALEYVVWRVLDRQIDWFVLNEERYEPLEPAADGILRSRVFPGLWLDPGALIRADVNAVFAIVQQGLNSPEHAEFVARLADAHRLISWTARRDRRRIPEIADLSPESRRRRPEHDPSRSSPGRSKETEWRCNLVGLAQVGRVRSRWRDVPSLFRRRLPSSRCRSPRERLR